MRPSLLRSQNRKQTLRAQSVASVGIELAISLLVGVWLGGKVDGWLGTDNAFRLVGLFVGLAAGFRSVFVLAKAEWKKSRTGSSAR